MSTTRRTAPYKHSDPVAVYGFEESKDNSYVSASNLITQEIYIEKLIRDTLIKVKTMPDEAA
jgi:hypothetical protein